MKRLSVEEIWYWTARRDTYRRAYAKIWNDAASTIDRQDAEAARPLDVILCPVGPGAAPPFDNAKYWGYTSQWNLLHYPALVFPVSKVDPHVDVVDKLYQPLNEKDEFNHRLC